MCTKNSIKMCVLPNFMPYSDIKDGKLAGAVSDYMALIEKKIQKPLTLVPTNTWAESLEFAQNRKCDIVTSIAQTKERENYFNFTKPYMEIPFVLLTKAGNSFVDNLSMIKNKKISVVENYTILDSLQSKYKDIEFIKVKNIDEGLEKILNGETFVHIDGLSTSLYKLQTKYLTQISISAKLDETSKLSVAVRNDDDILYGIFQKVISSIDDLQKNEIMNKWVTIEYKKEFDYSILWKVFLVVLIILLAILYKQIVLRNANNSLKEKVMLKK